MWILVAAVVAFLLINWCLFFAFEQFINAGCWWAARRTGPSGWVLDGCTSHGARSGQGREVDSQGDEMLAEDVAAFTASVSQSSDVIVIGWSIFTAVDGHCHSREETEKWVELHNSSNWKKCNRINVHIYAGSHGCLTLTLTFCQAIFLLEYGQTDRQNWSLYPHRLGNYQQSSFCRVSCDFFYFTVLLIRYWCWRAAFHHSEV